MRLWLSSSPAFLTNTVNRHFTLGPSHLTKVSHNKPDQTSPRERAKTAALHEKSKDFLPAILAAYPDGKNCEVEGFPVRFWIGSSPPTSASPLPKPLEWKRTKLEDWTLEMLDVYFDWCVKTAWDKSDEDTQKEYDPDKPLPSKFIYKRYSGEANNQGCNIKDLDPELSAEVKADELMTDVPGETFAEPKEEKEEEMTDAPELPMQDWYASLFSSGTMPKSFSQYRHTPLVRLSLNGGDDTATSSVPGLNDEAEDQAVAPRPLSPEGQQLMAALCEGIFAMHIKPVNEYKLFQGVPQIAGSKRRIPDDYMLYPIPKRNCLPAKSSSSADESASKTRHISGIHARLLAYPCTGSGEVAASQPGSRTKSSSALQGRRVKAPSARSALFSKGATRPRNAVSSSEAFRPVANADTNSASINQLTDPLAKSRISAASAPQAIEKQVVPSSAAANHSSQQVELPSTNFAPSKKPGSFGISTSKSNAIPSNSTASGSNAMEIDMPPTASSQSAKPSSTSVNNQTSNVVASSPNAHGLLSSGRGSTSTHFVQSKKPGTWLNQKPRRDAVPAGDGRATQGNGSARRGGQAPAGRAAQTGKNISEARPIGVSKNGFRDRSDEERKELEGMLHQVPEQFKIDVHKVIQSQVCDMVPGRSDESVRSIPDLAKTGVGASVGPHPFADKFRSKADSGRDIAYFRELRQQTPQVWLHLITMILQSGRSPKDIFENECDGILGAEWVTDFERIDRVAREGSAADSKAFFTREDVAMTLRPAFDHAVDKMINDGCKVFEVAVKNWVKHDKSGGNRDLFLQCLERAGWIQAHSHLTRFISWATGDAPSVIKRVCSSHFRWAFPRLLHAVSGERLEKTQPSTVK